MPKRQHAIFVGNDKGKPRVVARRLPPRGAVAAPSHPVARQAVIGDYLAPTANPTLGQALSSPVDIVGSQDMSAAAQLTLDYVSTDDKLSVVLGGVSEAHGDSESVFDPEICSFT